MPSLSATIITRDEARRLERAIRSLAAADEIVVVDSGSTDGTVDLARRLGARVLEHPWEGFAAQKNFAAGEARHDWIMSLDADEELDPDAQDFLRIWKTSLPRAAAYRLPRRARYCGRWIRHSGWYPDWKIRLYDRRRGRFEGAYVHESVVTEGPVAALPGEILHYTCDSLAEHRERIEFYTGLAAREMFDRGESVKAFERILLPPWAFVNAYFLRLGVLDGAAGFDIAWMAARYVRRKYAKLDALRAGTAALP
jgi:glycosyltransferase involved in cell wall biosynthesis